MVLTRTIRTVVARAGLAIAAVSLVALAPAPAASASARADTSDFEFASFDAVYELSADEAGRSVLRTTETLVAEFPEIDQNRGIRRAIPLDYDGHPVEPRILEVTDGTGAGLAYETDEDDGFLIVTIADDDYVHGEQTYEISYVQHNVTHVPDDARIDEFAWDVNGVGWDQPFGRVSAELRVDPSIAGGFTGDAACYRGPEGSTTPCDDLAVEPEPLVIRAGAAGLGPRENLTIAAGFEAGTFTPRDDRFFASPFAIIGAIGTLLAVAAAAIALIRRATAWRSHPGRGIIVAEYEPPAETTVLEAADLAGHPERGVAATLLALAVGGHVRIVETKPKKFAVEAGPATLSPDPDARELEELLFPGGVSGTAQRSLETQDAKLAKKLYELRTRVAKRVVANGWRRTPDVGLRVALAVVAVLGGVVGFVFGIVALDAAMGGPWPLVLAILAGVAAIATPIIVAVVRPFTEPGRALRDRLEGLRVYISLAEADRLQMLQSPSGALRGTPDRPEWMTRPSGAVGAAGAARVSDEDVLRLTERLLPYSVLFGLDKEWSRELAALYDARDETPTWFAGRDGFTAAAFATSVHSFSTASTASWSGSSSSSSSSSSGGGGASGGGGGGGGGGGV
jgi:uncharacterized membrane protein YgcG